MFICFIKKRSNIKKFVHVFKGLPILTHHWTLYIYLYHLAGTYNTIMYIYILKFPFQTKKGRVIIGSCSSDRNAIEKDVVLHFDGKKSII